MSPEYRFHKDSVLRFEINQGEDLYLSRNCTNWDTDKAHAL